MTLEPEAAAHPSPLWRRPGLLASETDKLRPRRRGSRDPGAGRITIGVRHGESVETGAAPLAVRRRARLPSFLRARSAGHLRVRLLMTLGTNLVGVAMARAYYDRGSRRSLECVCVGGNQTRENVRPQLGHHVFPLVRGRTPLAPRGDPSGPRAARDADMALKNTNISGETGILTDWCLLSVAERVAAKSPRSCSHHLRRCRWPRSATPVDAARCGWPRKDRPRAPSPAACSLDPA